MAVWLPRKRSRAGAGRGRCGCRMRYVRRGLVGRMRGRARTQPRRDGSMNGLELAYSQELERRRIAGEILRWDFEPEKLRLADRTFYTPDFRVILLDGEIEWHEVKGTWVGGEHNRVKIKVAAEAHPYRFVAVMARAKRDGGGWTTEEL